MKKLIKIMFLVILVSAVASAVASIVSKKKLSNMSDDEIREFLASKLSSKVGEEQLGSIQKAVIAGVRRGSGAVPSTDHFVEDVEVAVSDLADIAPDAPDDAEKVVADAAGDDVEAAADVADEDDA